MSGRVQDNDSRQLPALEVDHLGYLTSRQQRRQVQAQLRRLARRRRGELTNLTVQHEQDGSCCRREVWAATLARIVSALVADGETVGYLGPGGALVAGPPEAG
ncbi:MAG: hypothetical protein DLM67_13815 [Candidatus Nephthysia bennettiae]|nr:MAG: hypothetical protein DLM67_13815 [Candidatus Dormibacteraeota bacterium]